MAERQHNNDVRLDHDLGLVLRVVVVVVRCLPIRFNVGGVHLMSDESRDVAMGKCLHQAQASLQEK